MPTKKSSSAKSLTAEERHNKIVAISVFYAEIMKELGLDLKDPSLRETPSRVARMLVNEVFKGLTHEPPKMTSFPLDKNTQSNMVIVKDINLVSVCEHHMLPIIGKCHISYIPKNGILGLSKFNRIVDYLSSKPQVQERLTDEIGSYLVDILKTESVAVVIEAVHFCTTIRGIKDQNSKTITSYINGAFNSLEVRSEFLNLIK